MSGTKCFATGGSRSMSGFCWSASLPLMMAAIRATADSSTPICCRSMTTCSEQSSRPFTTRASSPKENQKLLGLNVFALTGSTWLIWPQFPSTHLPLPSVGRRGEQASKAVCGELGNCLPRESWYATSPPSSCLLDLCKQLPCHCCITSASHFPYRTNAKSSSRGSVQRLLLHHRFLRGRRLTDTIYP